MTRCTGSRTSLVSYRIVLCLARRCVALYCVAMCFGVVWCGVVCAVRCRLIRSGQVWCCVNGSYLLGPLEWCGKFGMFRGLGSREFVYARV